VCSLDYKVTSISCALEPLRAVTGFATVHTSMPSTAWRVTSNNNVGSLMQPAVLQDHFRERLRQTCLPLGEDPSVDRKKTALRPGHTVAALLVQEKMSQDHLQSVFCTDTGQPWLQLKKTHRVTEAWCLSGHTVTCWLPAIWPQPSRSWGLSHAPPVTCQLCCAPPIGQPIDGMTPAQPRLCHGGSGMPP
jgi:hypothetical protein